MTLRRDLLFALFALSTAGFTLPSYARDDDDWDDDDWDDDDWDDDDDDDRRRRRR